MSLVCTKMCVDERQVSELYSKGIGVPQVDSCINKVMPNAVYDEKFPFYALFHYMTQSHCEMFMRRLIINAYKHTGRVIKMSKFQDKLHMLSEIETICNSDDDGVLFVKTVSDFL